MAPDLRSIARRLNGEVSGGQVMFPPPGHSPKDRSACLRFDQQAPGGFVIHSFAGDDPLLIRDFVCESLGFPLDAWRHTQKEVPPGRGEPADDPTRTAQALALWSDGVDPRGTPAEAYLQHRGLELSTDAAGEAIRFHPACPFAGQRVPAMVCLVRDVLTNEPRAIHRTALCSDGSKGTVDGHNRLSLGPISGGAIKLTPDEDVTTCLGIGEGLETFLSLRLTPEFGSSPVWCVLSAGGVSSFPVLPGIECLWIAVDNDPAGLRAAASCSDHWRKTGREVFLVEPKARGADLNDLVQKGQRNA